MAESPESRSVDRAGADFVEIRRERRPLHKSQVGHAPKLKEALAQVIAYLNSLHSNIEDETPEAEPSSLAPGQTILQAKRLSRRGVTVAEGFVKPYEPAKEPPEGNSHPAFDLEDLGEPSPQNGDPAGGDDPPFYDQRDVADSGRPRHWVPAAAPEGEAPDSAVHRHLAGWLALIAVLGLVLLCSLVYLWVAVIPGSHGSRLAPASPAAAGRPNPAKASDGALKTADQVIDSIQAGDFAKASGLLDQAQRQGIILPDMQYQGALLALTQGNVDEADAFIDRSIAANESVAECLYLRANLQASKGDYQGAADSFEEATRSTPFNPRYFFFYAECLRRLGNPGAAIPQFERALRCRPSSADGELILFKLGLAKIETGTDTEFQGNLDQMLSKKPVSGDTLLLAAANEINQIDYPKAAEYVRQAEQVLPAAILKSRLRDFAFTSQSFETPPPAPAPKPALAAGSVPPVRKRILVDPATRSLADADPGTW
jgi:tetratricopeptide (TPR) repeat protein